ncbi:MAG: hypothetical protein CFH18_00040 [Alphaproteobacteria bacterium MarineAlpha5_Bin8]|nr:MAG: hypothetical protein CFH17_00901 [Alphaproteobacteria bacterium MarineAlpha5_Bin7]PPR48353.1 MAG: hypothetical protein CFH18_00040 [Alphaproteobacteria bacterium MarineAlpha5_Bin8]PPR54745.1 MAG: hypothetical protein CFH16_00194 [Alphaproteobacteria bacterium MarineAlpha5_Bin6]|tara:strand:+ start:2327 stop:2878 length:552 start_codon:yes stop_codon:yes gene_type:complete
MTKEKNSDLFLLSLKGTRPIKKTNRITRPIPEQKESISRKSEKAKKLTTLKTETIARHKKKYEHKIETNKTNKKLKKGMIPIDKKIDLHGYSLNEAKSVFEATVEECFKKNLRCLLFVTGKGLKSTGGSGLCGEQLYHGKIRKNFVNWAEDKSNSNKILNIQQANPKYGGDGAFFVYLRKQKN